MTTQETLDEVEAAISKLLRGHKAVNIDGQTYVREGLDSLVAWRKQLIGEQMAELDGVTGNLAFAVDAVFEDA